jgi:hypothetical protein
MYEHTQRAGEPRTGYLRGALELAQSVGVEHVVIKIDKGRYAGDNGERLVGVPAGTAGTAP